MAFNKLNCHASAVTTTTLFALSFLSGGILIQHCSTVAAEDDVALGLPELRWEPLEPITNISPSELDNTTAIPNNVTITDLAAEPRQFNVINNLVSVIIGGGQALFRAATAGFNLAKFLGLLPTVNSFIIDNNSNCRITVECHSAFDRMHKIELEPPDGLIVKFIVSKLPFAKGSKLLTAWGCTFESSSGDAKYGQTMYGFGTPKPRFQVYSIDNSGVQRLEHLTNQEGNLNAINGNGHKRQIIGLRC